MTTRGICLLLIMMAGMLAGPKGQAQTHQTFPSFPEAWLGTWKGTLSIYQGQKVVQNVSMTVENASTDSLDVFIWALIYGDDLVAGRRDYRLKPRDKSKGVWVTDEQNSILLEGKVVANTYISVFEVGGNILTSKMTLHQEDMMEFEILVFRSDQFQTSGNTMVDGENIPEVKSYPVTGYQKAVLKKIE